MHDDDSECQFLEIVFVFKPLVDGNQDVALALGLSNQRGIGEGAPLGLGDRQDFMIRKGLPQTGINALV